MWSRAAKVSPKHEEGVEQGTDKHDADQYMDYWQGNEGTKSQEIIVKIPETSREVQIESKGDQFQ